MNKVKCTNNSVQALWDFFKEKGFEFDRNQFFKQIGMWVVNYSCGYRVLSIWPKDSNSIPNFGGKTNIRGVDAVHQVENALMIYNIII